MAVVGNLEGENGWKEKESSILLAMNKRSNLDEITYF